MACAAPLPGEPQGPMRHGRRRFRGSPVTHHDIEQMFDSPLSALGEAGSRVAAVPLPSRRAGLEDERKVVRTSSRTGPNRCPKSAKQMSSRPATRARKQPFTSSFPTRIVRC